MPKSGFRFILVAKLKNMTLKRHQFQILFATFAGLIVVILAVWLLLPREPIYQGKRLTAWMDELNKEWNENEPLARVTARQATWTNVVQSVGANALPYFLKWIPDARHPLRQNASATAIRILGPMAEPAIPGLVRLLKDEHAAHDVAYCLTSIGLAAVPALSNVVATTTNRECIEALGSLRDLGPVASPTVPMLIQIVRTNPNLANFALQSLVEVETNADALMPLLVEHLTDTNNAGVPAYGLGRIGQPGFPFLLQSLTNEARIIRHFAEAALSTNFQKISTGKLKVTPPERPMYSKACFNLLVLEAAFRSYSEGDFQMAAQTAQQFTNDPNPVICTAASNVLSYLDPILRTNPIPQAVRDERDWPPPGKSP